MRRRRMRSPPSFQTELANEIWMVKYCDHGYARGSGSTLTWVALRSEEWLLVPGLDAHCTHYPHQKLHL